MLNQILLTITASKSLVEQIRILTDGRYEAVHSHDLNSALDAVKRYNPAIILIEEDLILEKGSFTCSNLKSKCGRKRVGVLVMTNRAVNSNSASRARVMGADDLVALPIRASDFMNCLDQTVRNVIHPESSASLNQIVQDKFSKPMIEYNPEPKEKKSDFELINSAEQYDSDFMNFMEIDMIHSEQNKNTSGGNGEKEYEDPISQFFSGNSLGSVKSSAQASPSSASTSKADEPEPKKDAKQLEFEAQVKKAALLMINQRLAFLTPERVEAIVEKIIQAKLHKILSALAPKVREMVIACVKEEMGNTINELSERSKEPSKPHSES